MHAWCAAGVAPALLPAVLMLLRTKSREVVKSVLGFVKVTKPFSMPLCRTVFSNLPALLLLCRHCHVSHSPWRVTNDDCGV